MILAIASLFLPLLWELWSDRKGETVEEKMNDAMWRGVLIVGAGLINFFLINKPIFDAMFLSLAIHWLLFDYLITWWLIKKGVIETHESWFEYLGVLSKVDNFRPWVQIGPWGRFTVKIVVFIIALIIFIV